MEQKEMNLDQFGEVMDKFITENEISMLITMPKGTQNRIAMVKDAETIRRSE